MSGESNLNEEQFKQLFKMLRVGGSGTPISSLNAKPTDIAMNSTLKKFSFLWNFAVKPIITKAITTIKIGFKISDR